MHTYACICMARAFCKKESENTTINKAFCNYMNTIMKDKTHKKFSQTLLSWKVLTKRIIKASS